MNLKKIDYDGWWNRMEKDTSIKDSKNYEQLELMVSSHCGDRWTDSAKQVRALKRLAAKHHIGHLQIFQDKKNETHYRNVGSGRFVSRKEYEKYQAETRVESAYERDLRSQIQR